MGFKNFLSTNESGQEHNGVHISKPPDNRPSYTSQYVPPSNTLASSSQSTHIFALTLVIVSIFGLLMLRPKKKTLQDKTHSLLCDALKANKLEDFFNQVYDIQKSDATDESLKTQALQLALMHARSIFASTDETYTCKELRDVSNHCGACARYAQRNNFDKISQELDCMKTHLRDKAKYIDYTSSTEESALNKAGLDDLYVLYDSALKYHDKQTASKISTLIYRAKEQEAQMTQKVGFRDTLAIEYRPAVLLQASSLRIEDVDDSLVLEDQSPETEQSQDTSSSGSICLTDDDLARADISDDFQGQGSTSIVTKILHFFSDEIQRTSPGISEEKAIDISKEFANAAFNSWLRTREQARIMLAEEEQRRADRKLEIRRLQDEQRRHEDVLEQQRQDAEHKRNMEISQFKKDLKQQIQNEHDEFVESNIKFANRCFSYSLGLLMLVLIFQFWQKLEMNGQCPIQVEESQFGWFGNPMSVVAATVCPLFETFYYITRGIAAFLFLSIFVFVGGYVNFVAGIVVALAIAFLFLESAFMEMMSRWYTILPFLTLFLIWRLAIRFHSRQAFKVAENDINQEDYPIRKPFFNYTTGFVHNMASFIMPFLLVVSSVAAAITLAYGTEPIDEMFESFFQQ